VPNVHCAWKVLVRQTIPDSDRDALMYHSKHFPNHLPRSESFAADLVLVLLGSNLGGVGAMRLGAGAESSRSRCTVS
jgi:hypothetical protein